MNHFLVSNSLKNKMMSSIRSITLLILAVVIISCTTIISPEEQALRQDIAQKLMLDFRYYCSTSNNEELCKSPMTELPSELKNMIHESGLGGVILFTENLTSNKQIIDLTNDLQKAALNSVAKSPMLIAIDQEGGRVFRTPRSSTTGFAGNMAIGATQANHGNKFATVTGKILALELKQLGINTNFAPDIDVNINPRNPVINVRSFGQSAELVAELGLAQMNAMQQEGILATLKHFPGHGDTESDSHLGLPVVSHQRAQIDNVDLLPFRKIIAQSQPAMVMTAHIQYPHLDSSTLPDKLGQQQIKPATLSRKILTGILREELNYKGLIVSDAMNMHGISHFFDQFEAVVASFSAGTDIVVMPMPVHTPEGITKFNQLIDYIVEAVEEGKLSRTEISQSAQLIRNMKSTYKLDTLMANKRESAIIDFQEHKQAEQQLADSAITLLKGKTKDMLLNESDKFAVLMPDDKTCSAIQHHLALYRPAKNNQCFSLKSLDSTQLNNMFLYADTIMVGSVTPSPSVVEMGGMSDLKSNQEKVLNYRQVQALLPKLMTQAQQANKKVILAYLRMPYDFDGLAEKSSAILASYSNTTHAIQYNGREVYTGSAIDSLARVLTGQLIPQGKSPMNINGKTTSNEH